MNRLTIGFMVLLALLIPIVTARGQDDALVVPVRGKEKLQNIIVVLKGEPLLKRHKYLTKDLEPAQIRNLWQGWDLELLHQQKALLAEIRGKKPDRVKHFRQSINAIAMSVSRETIAQLREKPEVLGLFPDTRTVGNLDGTVVQIQADQVWTRNDPSGNPILGSGVLVAILDSGIDYSHPDLGGGFGPEFKVQGGYDFVDNDADPMDENGHGTHVAGIVAANGAVRGVAPDAHLLAYRVLDSDLAGTESVAIEGLERASNPDGDPATNDAPQIINLSLSSEGDSLSPLALAANTLADSGILIVASAGNLGAAYGAIRAPGAAERVLTVGASSLLGGNASFSSQGPALPYVLKPNLLAPGQFVNATWLNRGYSSASGTSQASAHVAGAAALLMQAFPNWTADQVRLRLTQNAGFISNIPFVYGSGLLQVLDALDSTTDASLMDINFGRVDLGLSIWNSDVEMVITNSGAATENYEIIDSNNQQINGGLVFLPSKFALGPGQSKSITVRALVNNNDKTNFPNDESLSIRGLVGVTTESRSYILPYTMRKSWLLTINLPSPNILSFRLESDSSRIERTQPVASTHLIHTWPGRFNLILSGLPEDDGDRLWFSPVSDLLVFKDVSLDIDPAQATIQPKLEITDLSGRSFSISSLPEGNTGYSLTHLPSGKGFSMLTTRPLDVSLTSLSNDYLFEVAGLAPVEGKFNTFSEFGYHFRGTPASNTLSFDMRNNKAITFSYDRVDDLSSQIQPALLALNLDRINSGITPPNLTHGLVSKAPVDWTFYFQPQGNVNPEEEPYRQLFRRLSFQSVQGETISSRLLRVLDSSQVTFSSVELLSSELMDLETLDLNQIRLDYSLVAPGLRWINSSNILRYFANDDGNFFSDSWQNSATVPQVEWSFEEPGGNVSSRNNWEDFSFFESQFAFAPSLHRLTMDYHSRLEGQAVTGTFIHEFDLGRGDKDPPYINNVHLVQNGLWTDRVIGDSPASLILRLNDSNKIDAMNLELRTENGWVGVATTNDGQNNFTASIPAIRAGHLAGLRFTATDPAKNMVQLELPRAFRVGETHIIPWVVNNQQWESRIAITNLAETSMEAVLTATTTLGEEQTRTLSIPAKAVYAATATELFGVLSGYSLQISAINRGLYPSFLTFNKEEASGGSSPSQTTAAGLDELNPRLMFPYLPGDQIPAIVLCAPDRGGSEDSLASQTPVSLLLYDQDGQLVAIQSLQLTGRQPMALLVEDLFQTLPAAGTVVALAGNGTRLAGTTFIFNQQREPSMATGVSQIHSGAALQVIPWVVNNSQWLSRIAVYNQTPVGGELLFSAITIDGQSQETRRPIGINQVLSLTSQDLFPGLSGYSLSIKMLPNSATVQGDIYVSFLTFNLEEASGGNSPSQTTGCQASDMAPSLLFAYVPTDQIPAIVLVAPKAEDSTRIILTAYGPAGGALATQTITLEGNRPFASLISGLFEGMDLPSDLAVLATAENGVDLAGITFVFNNMREPSMAKPFPLRNQVNSSAEPSLSLDLFKDGNFRQ